MKKWTRWQDWVAVFAGLYVALSTIWTPQFGASLPMMAILGVLLAISGLVNLAFPGLVATEWVQAAIGALLVISPWVGNYSSHAGVAWTSWIFGVIGIVVGVWALRPAMRMHQHPTATH